MSCPKLMKNVLSLKGRNIFVPQVNEIFCLQRDGICAVQMDEIYVWSPKEGNVFFSNG